jgi:multiple sugar transport system permease protein
VKSKKLLWTIFLGFASIIVFLWATFPFWWMLLTSLKPSTEALKYPPTFLPKNPTLSNYGYLFKETNYLVYFKNTILTSLPATLMSLFLGSLAAYGLSRFKFMGSRYIPTFSLICYMLPRILLVLSLYGVFKMFNLIDTHISISILHMTFCLPYSLWLLRSYFNSIPIDLEEAAQIDGSTRLQCLTKIVLPLALPGMISTFIFVFIISWSDYLYSLIMISTDLKKTLTLGIVTSLTSHTAVSSWGALMAAGVVMTLPIMILFVFIQKWVVSGFTAGAIKE